MPIKQPSIGRVYSSFALVLRLGEQMRTKADHFIISDDNSQSKPQVMVRSFCERKGNQPVAGANVSAAAPNHYLSCAEPQAQHTGLSNVFLQLASM